MLNTFQEQWGTLNQVDAAKLHCSCFPSLAKTKHPAYICVVCVCLQNGESVVADAAAAVAGAAALLPPASYPLTPTANSFLAGVLDHLPGLLPFTAPSVNSYERLKPGTWSGRFMTS